MKTRLRLLLPALNRRALDLFASHPGRSLLAPGNLPAISRVADIEFCFLVTTDDVAALEDSAVVRSIREYADVQCIPIDDLVLDRPFDVVSSLAYMRGITDCGAEMVNVHFMFLQPDLVFADGALRSVYGKIAAGTQVLLATYLTVEPECFDSSLTSRAAAEQTALQLTPHELAQLTLNCLNQEELSNFVNLEFSLAAPASRFIWRVDETTIIIKDLLPSLFCIRPERVVAEAAGYRDLAFAADLCPSIAAQAITDSDKFCAVRWAGPTKDGAINLGQPQFGSRKRKLSAWVTSRQFDAAQSLSFLFHAGGVPSNLSQIRADADDYVRGLLHQIKFGAKPIPNHPDWMLENYLWQVRRFELKRGPFPRSPFDMLLAVPDQGGAAPGSLSGKLRRTWIPSSLLEASRLSREIIYGRAPFVSWLHPQWADFRAITRELKPALGRRNESVLYVADVGLLGRILGPPSATCAALLDPMFDMVRLRPKKVDLAVVEVSAHTFRRWSQLVENVQPVVKHGGRIIVFCRDNGSISTEDLGVALASGLDLFSALVRKRVSIAMVHPSRYCSWLERGFDIAQTYARVRRPAAMIEAALLIPFLSVLTGCMNLVRWASSAVDAPANVCSSVTITVKVPVAPFGEQPVVPNSASVATTSQVLAGLLHHMKVRTVLRKIGRFGRDVIYGRTPFATLLHPQWADFRTIAAELKSALRRRNKSVVYVADNVTPLGRILGSPFATSSDLLDPAFDMAGLRSKDANLAVLELSAPRLRRWLDLVEKVQPAVEEGGRIAIFCRDSALIPASDLNEALAEGLGSFDTLGLKRFSITVIHPSRYQSWLEYGYDLALSYARLRRPAGVIKALLLLPILTILAGGMNLARWVSSAKKMPATTCSSLTITMENGKRSNGHQLTEVVKEPQQNMTRVPR